MDATLGTGYGTPSADGNGGESREPIRLNDSNPSESHASLQRALRALSGIRQRYEVARRADRDTHFYRMHVVVDPSDLSWIAATIEALKSAIADAANEPGRASDPRETVRTSPPR